MPALKTPKPVMDPRTMMDAAAMGNIELLRKLTTDLGGTDHALPPPSAIGTGVGGVTPLHVAATYGRTDAIRFLLDRGADVLSITDKAHTALHCAAACGHVDACTILVQRGAELFAINSDLMTPLDLARQERHENVVYCLQKFAATNPRPTPRNEDGNVVAYDEGANAAFDAASNMDLIWLKEAFASGRARIDDVAAKSGDTLVHSVVRPKKVADEMRRMQLLRWLVSVDGCPVNALNADEDTPLVLAARNGLVDAVKLLLDEAHADVMAATAALLDATTDREELRALINVRVTEIKYRHLLDMRNQDFSDATMAETYKDNLRNAKADMLQAKEQFEAAQSAAL
eukprot:PhM_4_TR12037/c0_g1_i1/m.14334